MSDDDLKAQRTSRRRLAIFRAIGGLIILLFVQAGIAYGSLQLFIALPAKWTGILDDNVIERAAHRGTVYMITRAIADEPQKSVPDILKELQPHFSFPLTYLTHTDQLDEDGQLQLQKNHMFYDDDHDSVYATLENGGYLKLGPLVATDIDDANTSAVIVLLALFSLLNALLFFIILYFAFSTLWREAISIRSTANKLGEGDLTARVPTIHSEPLKMIGLVINDMAVRIEMLVGHSKTMLHAMAHEFRTPLARLRFALTMLEEAEEKDRGEFFASIERDIKELEQLIKVSLDYSRMNNKNMPRKLQTVKVRPWAKNIIDSQSLSKPAQFKLTYDIPKIEAVFDPELAAIAFRNLLLNAFKYAHSMVRIRIFDDDDGLIFEFDDDGPGIPENVREVVFSPFFRLDVERSNNDVGYGVGLSFVRAIAELHHGSAFVLTSPLGGARFIMRFSRLD